MKQTAIATILGVALSTVAVVGAAHARNPHCAGGIQYVVQGVKDKEKGNLEDYRRQMLFLGHANALKDDLTAVENLRHALSLSGMPVSDTLRGRLGKDRSLSSMDP